MKKFGINQSKVASRVARGPGSLFGKADAFRAAHSGDYDRAVRLAVADNLQVPPQQRTAAWIIDAWRGYASQNEVAK